MNPVVNPDMYHSQHENERDIKPSIRPVEKDRSGYQTIMNAKVVIQKKHLGSYAAETKNENPPSNEVGPNQ